jgi:hypothetical protein
MSTVDMGTYRRLEMIRDGTPDDGVTLGEILEGLHERAFGFFLLLLALPCTVPFLYGLPQVVAFPLLLVSVQLMMGRRAPWLPESLSARRVGRHHLEKLLSSTRRAFTVLEYFSRPRISALSMPPLDRFVGLCLVLFSLSIMVPFPLTNTVPGIAIGIIAVGMIERDGLFVLAGTVLGIVWVGLLVIGGAQLIQFLFAFLRGLI